MKKESPFLMIIRRTPSLFTFFCLFICFLLLTAQAQAKQVEYEPAWDDTVTTITDLSTFLEPAGQHGKVVVCGDHLCFEDGTRARFWGVNLVNTDCCPPKEQAEQIAAHIAKLGFNAVRIHHLATPTNLGMIIFQDIYPQEYQRAMQNLDKFDYFVSRLKAHGIYLFLPSNHFPPWRLMPGTHDAEELKQGDVVNKHFTRYATIIDPFLQEQQKRFITIFMNHINPYTGVKYANEPALAFFEIANENSAVDNQNVIDSLPQYYQQELDTLWSNFLQQKYQGQSVYGSWGWCTSQTTGNILPPNTITEKHNGASGYVVNNGDITTIVVTAPGPTFGSFQYTWRNVPIEPCKKYTFSFRARANTQRKIGIIVQEQGSPWAHRGLNTTITLTDTFQDYSFDFIALPTTKGYKVALAVGKDMGNVEFSNASLIQSSLPIIPPRPVYSGTLKTDLQRKDYFEFLAELDKRYYSTFRDFIRQQGFAGIIIGTQPASMLGLKIQDEVMDVIDTHGYWDHPTFPSTSWSLTDWRIKNTPMILSPQDSPLALLSWKRIKGKPFIVSEYNHAFPNEYDAEALVLLAAYAGLQDWDAVFVFHLDVTPYEINRRKSLYFSLNKHGGKLATLPLARTIFNSMEPGNGEISLTIPHAVALESRLKSWKYLDGILPFANPSDFISKRISISFGNSINSTNTEGNTQITWVTEPTNKVIIQTEKAQAVVGFVYRETLGDIKINLQQPTFGVLGIASIDSGRKILVAVGKTEIPGMQWNDTRTSLGDRWGQGKALVYVPEMDIEFRNPVTIQALNEAGEVIGEFRGNTFELR